MLLSKKNIQRKVLSKSNGEGNGCDVTGCPTVSPKKDRLREATCRALKIMKDSGLEIKRPVEAKVDPDLPLMGYS